VTKAINAVFDTIFPGICVNCKDDVVGQSLLCSRCEESIIVRKVPKQIGNRFLFASTEYENPVARNLIKVFKYSRIWRAGEKIAEIMLKHLEMSEFEKLIENKDNTYIVPVPIHFLKKWQRGFNQAEVLSELLGKNLGIKYINALKRHRRTIPQNKIKSDHLRLINIQNCFSLSRRAHRVPKGATIILVDDIATSGETLKEATRVLRSLHPSQIIYVSFASR
jgi:ComF family protein